MSDRLTELEPFPDHSAALAKLVGQSTGPAQLSPHAVNSPMIQHWVEAMGDHNGLYVSDEVARSHGYEGAIAPPTMLQAWIMRGLRATMMIDAARESNEDPDTGANDSMMHLLDLEGLTSVVATNCEQRYSRPLVVGDRLLVRSVIEGITDPKRTGLGTGRFITTRLDFTAVADAEVGENLSPEAVEALARRGEPVATMRFRILKYLPGDRGPAQKPPRPRPALTQDNAFWFEGAREHRLLIQHCTSCGTLRHPPLPACGTCRSFEWDTVTASGRGTLYSFVVVHFPQVPSFDYPLAIGLVELEEGTRVVANIEGIDRDALSIGMELHATFVDFDDELSLPVFGPATSAPRGAA